MDKKLDHFDLVILGGGASGLAASISSKIINKNLRVLIIEKNDIVGKKIKATGNGKCNITNENAEDVELTKKFMKKVGIFLKTSEQGRIYPYSESAKEVRNTLELRAKELGVELSCNSVVKEVKKSNDYYIINYVKDQGIKSIYANHLVVSMGGKAGPKFGTTGDGFRIAKELGENVSKVIPVLTGVNTIEAKTSRLTGLRVKGEVALFNSDKEIFREAGEVQFTDYGISGIVVFNMTKHMQLAENSSFSDFEIYLSPAPGIKIKDYIREIRQASFGYTETIKNAFSTLIRCELIEYAIRDTNLDINKKIKDLTDEEIEILSGRVEHIKFSPKGLKGWDFATCTKGGVKKDGLDLSTYESKNNKNLYFVGEIVDYDGYCGGFNLNHAWVSGIKAGEAIGRKTKH